MSEYGAMFSDPLELTIDVAAGTFQNQIHIGANEGMVLKLVDVSFEYIIMLSTHFLSLAFVLLHKLSSDDRTYRLA
jgi:hypothetical protein